MAKSTSPAAVAHFVAFLNGSAPYYYDLDRKGWTTKEVNAYADQLLQAGTIIEHGGDPYTYTIAGDLAQKKAADLEHNDVIIDPEGNEARVIRIRRLDHQRGRLETDLGVAVVQLSDKFPIAP